MGDHDRRGDIQGMRALAVLLVVLYHAGLPPRGGFVGVDVFFVISGFVITRVLWRELQHSGTIDLSAFYSARARRLLPALSLLLICVAIASAILQSPFGSQQVTARTGIAAAVFTANASLFLRGAGDYFALPAETNPLLHTWTLAVEEQIYLVFPLALSAAAVVARRRGRDLRRSIVVVLIAGLVSSLVACVAMTHYGGEPFGPSGNRGFAFYASPLRGWEFAVGALLAVGESRLAANPRRVAVGLGVIGIGLVLAAAAAYTEATAFPGVMAAVPVAGTALLIAAGCATTSGVTAALARRPFTWLGDVSYGWYLWHWPAIVFTRSVWPATPRLVALAVAFAALLPTVLSYRLLEMPIRRDRRQVGVAAARLATGCVVVPLLLHGGLRLSTQHPTAAARHLQEQTRPDVGDVRGCVSNLPSDPVTTASCTWGVPGARGTAVLLGDSNARQFAEPAAAAAAAVGLDLTLATFSGCPFASLVTRYDGFEQSGRCRAFITAWTQHLELTAPRLVILASASTTYLGRPDVSFTSSGVVASDSAEKAAAWSRGLGDVVRRLDTAGVPTIVVHPVSVVDAFDLRACPAVRIQLGTCGRTVPRSAAVRYRRRAVEAERRAVLGHERATTLDLIDELCDTASCTTNRGNRWIYRDANHVTATAARDLGPAFVRAFRASVDAPVNP